MKKIIVLFILLMVLISGCKQKITTKNNLKTKNGNKFKIVHVMSWNSPWEWTDNQLKGFKYALKDVDVEYKIIQMDAKRKSTEEWKEKIGKEARNLIDSYKPDLVYTSDDVAQIYVSKYYINKSIPFVFSAVNAKPEDFGFVGSTNMAGVLELEHIVPTIRLLQNISPKVKRIAILCDIDPSWPRVIERIKALSKTELKDIDFISIDTLKTFSEFKNKIKELQTKADAIGYLGVFTYKDENGNNVPLINVQKWIVENNNLPDFSFWSDRIDKGTLCTVCVSAYEQGFAAGKIAHAILIDGKKPSEFEFKPTVKGEPIINLKRAKKLKLNITSDVLLSSKIIENYEWDK
jgi:ABC-type uncharacterized transport system substrate-binding protein